MKKWALFILFTSFCQLISLAQSPFGNYFQDSLKPGHRISGKLDSVDVNLANYQHTLPSDFNPFTFIFSYSDLNTSWLKPQVKRFSAIPHIAFEYSMGSRLDQFGKITYTQALDSNTFIQFDYIRRNNGGNLRNSSFERNTVQLGLMHRSKYYGTILDVSFYGNSNQFSNGLIGDSVRTDIPILLQEVEKQNAGNKTKELHIDWKNYISFTKDSLQKVGVILQPRLDIKNQRYFERDTVEKIYGFSNYDTINTYDYWELSSLKLNGGVFYKNRSFNIEAGLGARYWDYDNMVIHQDTTEISGFAALDLNIKGYALNALANYTFVGANGETKILADLKKSFRTNIFSVNAGFISQYPENYQRSYYGNTLAYNWGSKILSTRTTLKLNWNSKNRFVPFFLQAFMENNSKMPVFIQNRWRQDTLTSLNVLGVQAGFEYSFKKLLIQGRASYRESTGDLLPNWLISGRIAYNGGLFKAKKLKTVTGIEVGYISHYQLIDFVPQINTYSLLSTGQQFRDMMKLHFFTQFDLGYFRWFIRVENIEQTFVKPGNFEALGYPVTRLQFRFGVSWDFFN
ncbi:putative porin [Fluviicola sp.]|uniref:putative porin n=1 Tax=Fluviicola sp. TaxID=1917219 RepID=UPI003D282A40